MDAILIVAYSSFLSPIIPLIASFWVKSKQAEIRLIQYLLVFSLVFDLVSLMMGRNKMNSFPVTNLFFLVQATVLLIIYMRAFGPAAIYSRVTLSAFTIFFFINYFLIQGYHSLNTYSISISCLIFISFALSYFVFLLRNLPDTFVHRIPMVWINIGVLIYYAGNLFLFVVFNHLTIGTEDTQRVVWITIHNTLNVIKNILFLVAIWQSQCKINSSYS